MSMQDFISTLTDEQKAEFAKILASNDGQDPINKEVEQDVQDAGANGVTINPDFSVTRPQDLSNRIKVKAGTNTWVDDGEEHTDVETPEFTKVPRQRQAPVVKEYVCHNCGGKFKSQPDLIYGEFPRCNKCGGG